ncbi:MAG: spore cortex biosynthesis protein YabQ [Bacilli bacterium]
MTLFEQFQVSIGTIGFGGLIGLTICLINVLLENRKLFFIKLLIEPLALLLLTKLYFLFLIEVVDGILSLYYPLFLLGGSAIFFRFYYQPIKKVIIDIKKSLYIKIYLPSKLKIRKTYDKIISQIQWRAKRWAKRRKKPKIDS